MREAWIGVSLVGLGLWVWVLWLCARAWADPPEGQSASGPLTGGATPN